MTLQLSTQLPMPTLESYQTPQLQNFT